MGTHCRRIDLRSLNFKISHNTKVANGGDVWKPKNPLIILCIGFPPFIFLNVGSVLFNYDLSRWLARYSVSVSITLHEKMWFRQFELILNYQKKYQNWLFEKTVFARAAFDVVIRALYFILQTIAGACFENERKSLFLHHFTWYVIEAVF